MCQQEIMGRNDKMTGIRLSKERNYKIRYIAEKNYRSLTDEFNLMIDKHIKEYEDEHGPIEVEE